MIVGSFIIAVLILFWLVQKATGRQPVVEDKPDVPIVVSGPVEPKQIPGLPYPVIDQDEIYLAEQINQSACAAGFCDVCSQLKYSPEDMSKECECIGGNLAFLRAVNFMEYQVKKLGDHG